MLGQPKLIGLLTNRMSWLGAKAQIEAQNIAHADTAGYRAQDIKPFQELVGKNTVKPLQITSASYQPDSSGLGKEWHALELSKSTVQYQSALNIYKKYLGMVKTIIGRTG